MQTKIAAIFIILLAFCPLNVNSQEDYQKWLKGRQKNFQEFQEEEQKKFQEFKDKRDSAFVEFLKQEW